MQGWTRGALLALLVCAPLDLQSQERGAIALGELVQHLGVNARVLMIGAHPDDEDTNLITWLQRGRGVETAYLSLTRGDGGQNLIGNELGEALGVIRTEELLAARRIDGARQYFTRAFDFGFSKDTIDTFNHWQRDSILGDVVSVVRAFRPHVIVAVFSGTPRDGHGHHQVSGVMARAAFDLSGDTLRFPTRVYGAPWTVPKFYRSARGNAQNGTLGVDVGEYSPLLGRSFAEIAGESRSQHKSQGFGALQRKGPVMNYVRREASRVNDATAANTERSMFDGIDTSWARFRVAVTNPSATFALDSMPGAFARASAAFDPRAPARLMKPLASLSLLANKICPMFGSSVCDPTAGRNDLERDLIASMRGFSMRHWATVAAASGVSVEPIAATEVVETGRAFPVISTVYNRGKDTVRLSNAVVMGSRTNVRSFVPLAPGSMRVDTVTASLSAVTQPTWLAGIRTGGMFPAPATTYPAGIDAMPQIYYMADFGPKDTLISFFQVPAVFRVVDQVRGELMRPVAAVPTVSVSMGSRVIFAASNAEIDRVIEVTLRPATSEAQTVLVSLSLPAGIRADSAARTVTLGGATRSTAFRIRGRLSPGQYTISAAVDVGGRINSVGYDLVDYEHIRPQRVYRPASIALSAVDVRVPAGLKVGYVAGVGDNISPMLTQLGIPTTVMAAAEVVQANLASFTTVVIGPRAYEANPTLAAANPKLLEFARNGGTVVVQYGQYEMTQPGMTPFPITINRPHDRVTLEDSPVTILDPAARELHWPNKITDADFAGWVQERGLYMPRTFDAAYRALFAMNDPGENPNRGGVLVAPLGKGKYIYTSLAFFRQLPAGVPGSARLFVNLLSANLTPTRLTP